MAGPGHDHGDAPPVSASAASPRLEAHSDLFELVGLLGQGGMTLYLDSYATNVPITDAKIEYESGTAKGLALPQSDGSYLAAIEGLGKPGQRSFVFTINANAGTDLLAGDLTVPNNETAHDDLDHGRVWPRWARFAGYAIAVAALLLAALATLRTLAKRRARAV